MTNAISQDRQTQIPELIEIGISADIEELVPLYLAARRCDVAEMMSLLAVSDYNRLRILGHNMKGTGASYGFPELSRLGEELESAAKRTDRAALAVQIPQIDGYLCSVSH